MLKKKEKEFFKSDSIRDLIESFDKDKLHLKALQMKDGDSFKGITYGELQEQVRSVGNALLNMGVKKGDKIGILSENRIEWPIVYLAVASIGAVIVPFDIFLGSEELLPIINESDIKIIFTSVFFIEKIVNIKSGLKFLEKNICFDQHQEIYNDIKNNIGNDSGEISSANFKSQISIIEDKECKSQIVFEKFEFIYFPSVINIGKLLLQNGIDKYSEVSVTPDEVMALIYMNGTKFAMISHHALISNVYANIERLSDSGKYLKPGDKWLATLPYHHSYPVMCGFLGALGCYNQTVILESYKIKDIVAVIKETKVNYVATVPLLVELIYKEVLKKKNERDLSSVDFMVSGGAPLHEKVVLGLSDMGVDVLQGYGLTEYSPVASVNKSTTNRINSIGQPLPNVEAKIDSPDKKGNGELLIKGPSVMKGYYKMPDKTREIIDDENWLHTGDIARIDEDGFIFITGRLKNVIINKGGKNIYPEDIEALLMQSSYIMDAMAVPKIDKKMGEYLHAIIYPNLKAIWELEKESQKRFSEKEIKDLILREIKEITAGKAPYKIPGSIEISYKDKPELIKSNYRFMFEKNYKVDARKNVKGSSSASSKSKKTVSQKEEEQKTNPYAKKVEDYLLKKAEEILCIDKWEIDVTDNFLNIFTSIELVKISKVIEKDFEIELYPTILFEYTTINSLSEYFSTEFKVQIKKYFSEYTGEVKVGYDGDKVNVKNKTESVVTRDDVKIKQNLSCEPIAVVGMSGVFPGSKNLGEFWNNLEAGEDLISEVPGDRWSWEDYYGDPSREPGKTNVKWGGFIDDVDKFDAMFFGISPREAVLMDPQQRIFLETVWSAIEDAGYSPKSLSGTKTGLFAGISTSDYYSLLRENNIEVEGYTALGNAHSITPNRISYLLNLRGPSEAIDTACSSSLVTIHRAVESIQSGSCDLAIAGGVNLILSPALYVSFSRAGMLSEDGRCKTFDAGANGYVRGEGAGAVLLKPLGKAISDGDSIHALIKGTAINHGGKASSLTAPNPNAQAELLIDAYHKADISPDNVTYIEAHGTGTSLGDPVEINGLKKAFGKMYEHYGKSFSGEAFCSIGSVKTNIGHLEAAAGIAGIMKVILSMKNKKLPGNIHFKKVNPYIELEGTPFHIASETKPWDCLKEEDGSLVPRIAGVSSFGFGGANAHVVLEEYLKDGEPWSDLKAQGPQLIVLSAKNEERLKEYAGNLADFLERTSEQSQVQKSNIEDSLSLPGIAYTLQTGREAMSERVAFPVESIRELVDKLHQYNEGEADTGDFFNDNVKKKKNKTSLLFEGKSGEDYLKTIIDGNELDKIARLWVSGIDIDWSLLYNEEYPGRISLPTYPFSRERYWIDFQIKQTEKHNRNASVINENEKNDIKSISLPASAQKDEFQYSRRVRLTPAGEKNESLKIKKPDNIDDKTGAAISEENLLIQIKGKLKDKLSGVLFMQASEIDDDKPFVDFGLDSILGVELVKNINEELKINIKAIKLYDYSTINELSKYISTLLDDTGLENDSAVEETQDVYESADIKEIRNRNDNSNSPLVKKENPIVQIKEKLKRELAAVLFMDVSDIEEDRALVDFGLDSILGVELIKKVNEEFKVSIKAIKLYDYSTINKLSEYLVTLINSSETISDKVSDELLPVEEADDNKNDYINPVVINTASEKPESLPVDNNTKKKIILKSYKSDSVRIDENSNKVQLKHIKNEKKQDEKKYEKNIFPKKNISDQTADIAIVGMSGKFAGAKNIDDYWNNLANGVNSVTQVPDERWDVKQYYNPDPKSPNKTYCKWGGFLEDTDKFDALFFNISPKEAELMDPQQRLFLEEAWRAIEDSGYSPDSFSDKKCGVFVGVEPGDYFQNAVSPETRYNALSMTGNLTCFISARISYILNLTGPNMTIDSACSSSLVAIHQGCKSIINGESDVALAGGVYVMTTPSMYLTCCSAGMLSKDGNCKTFDNDADGFVPGEGVGVLVLKSLSKALEDNDYIYGVIKGSGVNQDGKTNGITAPSGSSQKELQTGIYNKYKINPEDLGYVEAHGTGTKLGDPIEVEALSETFRTYSEKKRFCAIGSVKTNIGHSITAAGVAGAIKVLLCLKNRKLVPSLNFINENEHIDFENSPFYVNTDLVDWKNRNSNPRQAAISSFGLSGTNAHMVMEEAPGRKMNLSGDNSAYYLIPLSAKTESALNRKLSDLSAWLEKEGAGYSTGDISYTHFIGRNHFSVRSAFIVKNIEELKDKIKRVLSGESEEYYLVNNLRQNKFMNEPASREAGKSLIGELSGCDNLSDNEFRDKLFTLADLYVKGYDLGWKNLFSDESYNRIPLPTYPFARERHWIPEAETDGAKLNQVPKLHPMIDANTSDLIEQKFSTCLTGNEFYLSDHVAGNQKVLPGVAYVEMARAAGELAGTEKIRRIRNIVWSRPLTISADSVDVNVSLYPGRNSLKYEVSTNGDDNDRVVYSQGMLEYGDKKEHNLEVINIESIKNRCTGKLTGTECYQIFKTSGLSYGVSFRTIRGMHFGERESLSHLELPGICLNEFSEYTLHPSLLDGALQSVLGLLYNCESGSNTSYLPFELGSVELLNPLTEKCYSYVTLSDKNKISSNVKRFNIALIDEDGKVLVKLRDFSVRPLQPSKAAGSKFENIETIYCQSKWKKVESEKSKVEDLVLPGNLLLFDKDDALRDELNRSSGINENNSNVILVKPDVAYNNESDNVYQINPKSAEDYRKLFESLSKKNLLPNKIIHNWSGDNFLPEENSIKSQLSIGLLSVFHLSKSLMELKLKDDIQLLYLYTGNRDAVQPLYAGLGGFVKTIRIENPGYKFKTVEIEKSLKPSDLLDLVVNEFYDSTDVEVRYLNDVRYVKQIEEFDVGSVYGSEGPVLLKDNGVYIITGGFGGLGQIFAEYLVSEKKVKLILTGRSELNEEKETKIKRLESSGSEVVYFRSDISKQEDVKDLINEIKSQYKNINGIIHSAGTTRDSFIVKKSVEEISEVIASKIYGTAYLDEATKDESLDFFVMFSSVASLFGNVGQCDYAYANSFMDNFAHMRDKLREENKRSGKTLSINWPLWAEGGMKVDEQTEKMISTALGIEPLSTEKGLAAFKLGMSIKGNQFAVLEGRGSKLRRFLGNRKEDAKTVLPELSRETANSEEKDILEKLEKELIKAVSDQLKVKESDIYTDADLSEYGFDSISLTEFSNGLNERYNLELTPAIFFELNEPSIRGLSEYFYSEFRDVLINYYCKGLEVKGLSAEQKQKPDETEIEQSKHRTRFQNSARVPAREVDVSRESIAIIGMSGVMPHSDDLEKFWENLEEGRDLISEIPEDRWDWKAFYGDPSTEANKTNIKYGGFMKDVDKFDAAFFNISPREAELMDPQQRIFLETAWKTIEDAGYKASELSGSKTGLFVGVASSDYSDVLRENLDEIEAYASTGIAHSVLANRISFLLNLHGPSEPIDTACSSSLVAIHRGIDSIRSGDCDMAIAGGVNVIASPTLYISFGKVGMLCEDGKCKTFDKSANGYVRGEGSGAVLLKPLSKALADGDHIYALIKGSAVNHGGHANSLTAPNANAQSKLLIDAYDRAGIDPGTISYIEAHGTGTSLGDPVEVNGLKKAFKELYKRWDKPVPETACCGLGSVKTNIGHLETAAGIAGVIKVLLSMKHDKLPAHINYEELNPYIKLEDTPFYILDKAKDWHAQQDEWGDLIPRRAGVSSFGFGGANAHVVLEEYIDEKGPCPGEREQGPQIIVLSAKNEERLKEYAGNIARFLEKVTNQNQNKNIDNETVLGKLQDGLKQIVSELIAVKTGDIDSTENLKDYGFDLVKVAEFANIIFDKYSIEISPGIISENFSIEQLSQYLIEKEKDIFPGKPGNMPGYIAADENAGENELSLSDIAYTLQVGREAMPERAAFVVENIHELLEKLNKYNESNADIDNFYSDNVKKKKNHTGLLVEGRSGEVFLKSIIDEKELDKLARLWVSGIDIDWSLLYQEFNPKRISLPTYPFTRDRYWVPKADTRLSGHGHVSKLHPMIGANTSDLTEQKFTTRLTNNEFYIADHMVGNQKVLPGVAYVEMARAAAELAGAGEVLTLKNIVWSRPAVLTEDSLDVNVSLYPGRDSIEYEVSTDGEDNDRIVYSQGRLVCGNKREVNSEVVDIDSIRNRCTEKLTGVECYRIFEISGLSYGTSFQPIRELHFNGKESLSRLELPDECRSDFSEYTLHPSIMDGALQTVLGLMSNRESSSTSYLPFALGEVEMFAPLPEKCYAHVTSPNIDCTKSAVKKFNIELIDEDGRVLLSMKDFSVRPLHPSNDISNKPEDIATMYCRSKWEEVEIGKVQVENLNLPGNILIFDTDEVLRKEFNQRFGNGRKRSDHVVLVKPGKSFNDAGDNAYEIDPESAEDYRKLLKSLNDNNLIPGKIIHNWSGEEFKSDEKSLESQLSAGLYSVFHLSQALMEQKLKDDINLLFVFSGISGEKQPQYAGLSGFARSINLENPGYKYKSVEIEKSIKPSDLLELVLNELDELTDVEVRYSDNVRYVKRINEYDIESVKGIEESLFIKEEGVYLITGGMGGLGLIFAEYLSGDKKVKLILTGRSELNDEIEAKIKKLESSGSEITYIRSDISKQEDVKDLINEIKSQYKNINGIIHAAGMTRDSFIIKKRIDEITEVLAPKVFGTAYLDEATSDESLDFFVMFSSVASQFGNVGQCDYAYANSFMDSFAHMRENLRKENKRSGKTLSINWPLWEEGGMRVDEQTEKMMATALGIKPLQTEKGLAAFSIGMSMKESQFIVLHGIARKLRRLLGSNEDRLRWANKEIHPPNPPEGGLKPPSGGLGGYMQKISETEGNDIFSKLEKDLVKSVSDILKVKIADMDTDADMKEYGFDSISLTEFGNKLNDEYNLELTPTIFFELSEPSISGLTEFLFNEFKDVFINYYTNGTVINRLIPEQKSEEAGIVKSKHRTRFQEQSRESVKEVDISNEPIAIIGMSGIMPGSDNLDQFWKHLEDGKDLISEIPKDRFDWEEYYGDPALESNKSNSKWGGFIKDVDKFDPLFFGISPREAELMDPQQRIFLETVWASIEDAGYAVSQLAGSETGLFVGVSTNDYALLFSKKGIPVDAYSSTGLSHSILANRISYLLNIHGPSEIVDTACSSSTVALHRAVSSIHSGECNMAIAGGVNLLLCPEGFIAFSQTGMLSTDGTVNTFDKDAGGYVRGEGAGAVLLKPLSSAIADGDHIYALIKGSAVNHGGKGQSLTSPNPNAQAEVIVKAYEKSGIDPGTVSYIEAQGTGSLIGDPIEITAYKKAMRTLYERWGHKFDEGPVCGIGSLKPNIGHLEPASGMAALIKVVLALGKGRLTGVKNFTELNPYIDLKGSPFYIVRENQSWEQLKDENGISVPRRAGLHSFGFGGVNAHLVLEEFEKSIEHTSGETEQRPQIIILSAKNEERLKEYAGNAAAYIDRCESGSDNNILLSSIVYTLQVGREAMSERAAFVVESIHELKDKLIQYCEGVSDIDNVYTGNVAGINKKSNFLLDGEEAANYIRAIISNRKTSKLAQLWISGVDIDWNLLYSQHTPCRISLPTYPFERTRYWMPELENSVEVVEKNKGGITASHQIINNTIDESKLNLSGNVQEDVVRIIAEAIKIDYKEIDVNMGIAEYGGDSIMLIRIINMISDLYDVAIQPSDLVDITTIKSFIDYLIDSGLTKREKTKIKEEPSSRRKGMNIKSEKVSYTETEHSKYVKDNFKSENIFITGATGVLGSYLLRELLLTTNSKIYSLVRAGNKENGFKRIKKLLFSYGEDKRILEEFNKRVIPVIGDITNDRLGLEKKEYKKLADIIDVTFHSAASTNLLLSYRNLELVNVKGTENVIDFALETKQKYIINTSSYSVMGDLIHKKNVFFHEDEFDVGQQFHEMGYPQSKFEAERIVREGASKGLIWVVVRPGNIYGDSKTGLYPFDLTGVTGVYYELFELIVNSGIAISGINHIDMTPVDYIAKSMVYLGLKNLDFFKTYHLLNPDKKSWNDCIKLFIEYGYKIDIISPSDYFDLVARDSFHYRDSVKDEMCVSLMKYGFVSKLMFENDGCSVTDYTESVLRNAGIECPKIDMTLLDTYLKKYIEIGMLPTPSEQKPNLNKIKINNILDRDVEFLNINDSMQIACPDIINGRER